RVRAAELRRRVTRLDAKLLDSVQAGSAAEVISFPDFVDRRAIEDGGVAVYPHPIRLHSPRRVAVAVFDAGHCHQKRRKAASIDRKLLDALSLERVAEC